MTEDELRTEIMLLRGELSAACARLGYLYKLVIGIGGESTRESILDKIRTSRPDPEGLETMGEDWARGIERFNDRLAKVLLDEGR